MRDALGALRKPPKNRGRAGIQSAKSDKSAVPSTAMLSLPSQAPRVCHFPPLDRGAARASEAPPPRAMTCELRCSLENDTKRQEAHQLAIMLRILLSEMPSCVR